MQTKKDDIRGRILETARQEFIEKGFEKASIRNITSAAKTSKSNIYNYFTDKDALFCAVVEDTLDGISAGFEKIRQRNRDGSASGYSMQAQGNVMREIMMFVFTHSEDIRLLCSDRRAHRWKASGTA
jgi:AcrR family transcriptional regulator